MPADFNPFPKRDPVNIEDLRRALKRPNGFASEKALDSDKIISRVELFLRRFIILPSPAYIVVATWCVATWLANSFAVFPYLNASSPEKRCGKTRLLELAELFCARPYLGVAPSSASLIRSLENCPTLLLDEVDQILRSKGPLSETQQVLVAIVNAGYKRSATVLRCDGPRNKPRKFPVYGPKAFASIGSLPSTISDRSIIVKMQRKSPKERVERFILPRVEPETVPLRIEVEEWANYKSEAVRETYETMADLDYLSDRDAEIWMPLLAVCGIAEPGRVKELTEAAKVLCGVKEAEAEDDSASMRLLDECREVWPEESSTIFLSTLHDLLLKRGEGSVVAEFDWSKRKLGSALRRYGLDAKTVRIPNPGIGDPPPPGKGYQRDSFEKVWELYLSPKKTENERSS